MRTVCRRALALLLCLITCLCLLPAQAFAAEDTLAAVELSEEEIIDLTELSPEEEPLYDPPAAELEALPWTEETELLPETAADEILSPVPAPFEEAEASLQAAENALSGWQKVSGKWYYYRDGSALTGWQRINNVWYYFNPDGTMALGWKKLDGRWYYFSPGGAMATGWQKINSTWYYFGSGGAMVTGWQKISNAWYYFGSGGAMVTGWQKLGSTWYYFNPGGAMATGWKQLNGYWYFFRSGGAMATGLLDLGGRRYYFSTSGAMRTGWIKDGEAWYYADPDGSLVRGETRIINGKEYRFDSQGVMEDTSLSPSAVYQRIMAQQSSYPEGMHWTNENSYEWNCTVFANTHYTGYGCVAFAMIMSDAAFGDREGRIVEGVDYDRLRPGDILRINNDTHSVILLEVCSDHVVIAEGNFNSSIHWGRTLTREEASAGDYVITRYPA